MCGGLQGLYGLVAYAIIRWEVCIALCVSDEKRASALRKTRRPETTTSVLYSQPVRPANDSNLVTKQETLKTPKVTSFFELWEWWMTGNNREEFFVLIVGASLQRTQL